MSVALGTPPESAMTQNSEPITCNFTSAGRECNILVLDRITVERWAYRTMLGSMPALSPASFSKYPPIMTMSPLRSHPACMRMRRQFPTARFPDMGARVPAVISCHPDMVAARSGHAMLHNGPWRPDLNHDICRIGRANPNGKAEQCCGQ